MSAEHRHDHPEPSPTVERMVVTRVTFRRGSGCCSEAPVRMVTTYYDAKGEKLFEADPHEETA